MNQVLRVAWYRFRATFGRRWPGYLAIVIFLGLLGGLAMGSIAAARRTQSSFPVFLASTNPPDLDGVTSFVNPSPGSAGLGYNRALQAEIARLPHVGAVDVESGFNFIPLGKGGAPESPAAFPATAGEVGGLVSATGRNLNLSAATEGRLFDLRSADEFMASATTAKTFDLHLGEVVQFGVYTNAQTALRSFGTAADVPYKIVSARLVGIVTSPSAVVEDDTDVSNNANLLVFTPALVRPLLTCCAYYTATALAVTGGQANIAVVAHEITRILPPGFGAFATNQAPALDAKAERAIKPESIALGVFGGVAALATLLIAGQIIGRQLRRDAEDLAVLRAVGAGTAMTTGDSLIGVLGAVVAGSLLAGAVAVGLSPLAPLGPVRPVYPYPGVAFDWTVLGIGLAVLIVGLGALTFTLAVRGTPHRASARRERADRQGSGVVSAAAKAGLPATVVVGIRFALESGRGRDAVPVRSAILGAALAVIIVVATVTFGSSLNTLVSHPALYGWNWSYELSANGGGVLPGTKIAKLLGADHDVTGSSGIFFNVVRIDGQVGVPVIAEADHAAVAPPLLSGHAVETDHEIVLGAITLAQLHKQVGDTVSVANGIDRTVQLQIVGTVTMPTIGGGNGNQHPEMGTGAVVPTAIFPSRIDIGYDLPGAAPGPDAILVRLRNGAGASGLTSLQQIARTTSTPADGGVSVLSVQHPAEIVNYRSMGSTPAILGASLAAGAVVALGLTLVASVRRRGRELALLKTLGFTVRQLAATVAWQSTVAVATGTIVGVPLGVVVGRWLWDLFAGEIDVVPSPNVPAITVVFIAVGALILANAVAAIPGRIAARTPIALVLRAE
jgi:hypothetical protein